MKAFADLVSWLFGGAAERQRTDRILVDREGVAYLPTREVKLRAMTK